MPGASRGGFTARMISRRARQYIPDAPKNMRRGWRLRNIYIFPTPLAPRSSTRRPIKGGGALQPSPLRRSWPAAFPGQITGDPVIPGRGISPHITPRTFRGKFRYAYCFCSGVYPLLIRESAYLYSRYADVSLVGNRFW